MEELLERLGCAEKTLAKITTKKEKGSPMKAVDRDCEPALRTLIWKLSQEYNDLYATARRFIQQCDGKVVDEAVNEADAPVPSLDVNGGATGAY